MLNKERFNVGLVCFKVCVSVSTYLFTLAVCRRQKMIPTLCLCDAKVSRLVDSSTRASSTLVLVVMVNARMGS